MPRTGLTSETTLKLFRTRMSNAMKLPKALTNAITTKATMKMSVRPTEVSESAVFGELYFVSC